MTMTRRRIIFASLALLLAAFVVAVQRDNFLRRWLLPSRNVPPTLAKRIGDFHVERVSFAEAVLAVERVAGKRMNFSESGRRVIDPFDPVTIDLHDATVEDAVCALLARTTSALPVTIK